MITTPPLTATTNHIGIEVSKQTLAVCCHQTQAAWTFTNDEAGHRALVTHLAALGAHTPQA